MRRYKYMPVEDTEIETEIKASPPEVELTPVKFDSKPTPPPPVVNCVSDVDAHGQGNTQEHFLDYRCVLPHVCTVINDDSTSVIVGRLVPRLLLSFLPG
jgi:hypothetical protein